MISHAPGFFWFAMLGFVWALLGASCSQQPPETTRVPVEDVSSTPNVLRTKTGTTTEESRFGLDPLGRLLPSADKLYGFDVPKNLKLVYEGPGMMSFELAAPPKPVTEFYTHRNYRVVKQPKGMEVSHTSETLEGQPVGVYDAATLFITVTEPNKHLLQFFSPSAPRNHLSKLNDKITESRTDISEKEKQETLQKIAQQRGEADKVPTHPAQPKETLNPTRRIAPRPFNPGVPSNVGRQSANPRIEQWLKDNPGKVFYD